MTDYLKMLRDEIHSVVFATVDEKGYPCTRVIDIMLADENGLYFITARGKDFYKQLMEKKYAAFSGMSQGGGSLSKRAVSVRGWVKNIGKKNLDKVFEENPYMANIYKGEESREALEVFLLYEGWGEFFDLSCQPVFRQSFVIGRAQKVEKGYFVTQKCRGCRICFEKCPQSCIDTAKIPAVIRQENCLHCGNCFIVCPYHAVERRR